MRTLIKSTVVLVCSLLFSCSGAVNKQGYVSFLQNEKKGLRKTVVAGELEYTLQYRPLDLILLVEKERGLSPQEYTTRQKDMAGSVWFNISFKPRDLAVSPLRYHASSNEEYEARLNYYLNEASHCIKLLYGTDTLSRISYLFENNYNLTPHETIVVGFALPTGQKNPQKDMQLCFNDKVFENGIIKATYRIKDVNNIPKLIE